MMAKIILILSFSFFISNTNAEEVLIGSYSGRPGYYTKIGTKLDITMNAIAMNKEVQKKLQELDFSNLSETKKCNVNGMLQKIGYSIFEIIKCE